MTRTFAPRHDRSRVAGKTLRFEDGLCEQSGSGFVVNIGTCFPSSTASKRPCFGLLVDRPRPGTHARQQLSYRPDSARGGAFVTVKLKSLRGGTFAGALVGGGRVIGSFSC
jgi:hypothetical protein